MPQSNAQPLTVSREVSPVFEVAGVAPSAQLLLSMRRFCALMQSHVEMLVSCAVELEDEKEKEKEKLEEDERKEVARKAVEMFEGGGQQVEAAADSGGRTTPSPPVLQSKDSAPVSMSKFNERSWWENKLGGEAGIAFMDRMMETQMYNAYAFDVKRMKRRKVRQQRRSTRGSVGSEDWDDVPEGMGQGPNPKTFRTRGSTTFADNFHSRNSLQVDFVGPPTVHKGEGAGSGKGGGGGRRKEPGGGRGGGEKEDYERR